MHESRCVRTRSLFSSLDASVETRQLYKKSWPTVESFLKCAETNKISSRRSFVQFFSKFLPDAPTHVAQKGSTSSTDRRKGTRDKIIAHFRHSQLWIGNVSVLPLHLSIPVYVHVWNDFSPISSAKT